MLNKLLESIEKLRDCTWIGGGKVNEYLDEIEKEISERYVLLPVDADGVPIHVGDVMCSAGIREKGHKVVVSAIFEDGFVEYGNDNGFIAPLHQEDWVHAKQRTLEDVLHDFANEAEWEQSHDSYEEIESRLITLYAAEIREMIGGEL